MLLNGLLAWLSDEHSEPLVRLLLVGTALMLLVVPLDQGATTAYSVGLILSVVVLWITPRLGQPRLSEGAWSWPYLPAVAATLTLIGLPFTLGLAGANHHLSDAFAEGKYAPPASGCLGRSSSLEWAGTLLVNSVAGG